MKISSKKIYSSSNDLFFGNTPKTKSKVDDYLFWTKNEIQFLETTTDFKDKKAYDDVNWEFVKDN